MRPLFYSRLLFLILLSLLFTTGLSRSAELEKTSALPLFTLEADFLMPSDVAVGEQNRIYVLDGTRGKIKVFSPEGGFIFSFGSKGQGKHQMLNAMGLDCDDGGMVYVADSGNHRIQIFDHQGKWLNSVSLPLRPGDKPPDPTDVAVSDIKDRFYVVDNDNHTILMYNKSTSQFLERWGSRGEVLGKFRYPFFIASGQTGAVAVVDLLNTRAQVFNAEGKFIHLVGAWGVDRGKFYRPKGITTDKHNRIYVSDSVLGVVQIFDPQGNFLSVVGTEAGEIMRFKTPVGIDVDHNLRLYVVEMSRNRVRAFQLQQ